MSVYPLRIPPLQAHLVWHERTHHDPAQKWMRNKIIEGTRNLIPPAAGPFSLFLDGLIGGVTALLVTALVPRNARRAAAEDGRTLFSIFTPRGDLEHL